MKYLVILVNSFLLLTSWINVNAQDKLLPFDAEIKAFKKSDSSVPSPQHAILFVGSSSFNKWKDVQAYFPAYPIINRGFGGSTLPDVIRYAGDVIFPYHPKQIVIYCGDNDLAANDTITAQIVFQRFKTLFTLIRQHLNDVPIMFVSIKPSPSRRPLMGKMKEANQLIESFMKQQKAAVFVDVYHKMLTKDGMPVGSLFMADSLHMNKNGYLIWQKEIAPYLLK